MSASGDCMNPPAADPVLAAARREWLRAHPAWTIDGDGFALCLLDSVGREWEALDSHPGPLWLSVRGRQLDAGTLARIGGLPGLTGLQLHKSCVEDREFIRFAEAASNLTYLLLDDPDGITGEGLKHLADLPNLVGLGLLFRKGTSPDGAFLGELAGDRSPRAFVFSGVDTLADSTLDSIAGWVNLETCFLSLAADVRGDLPWLAGMRKMRSLNLDCDGPLTLAGLARLGGLAALTELGLCARSFAPEGLRHLSTLENLAELTLYANEGRYGVSNELAGCKNLRSLSICRNYNPEKIEITTADLMNFASMPRLETLFCTMGFGRESDISVLSAAPNLKEVDFDFFNMKSDDSVLEKLSTIRGLAKLELNCDACTGRGLAALAALPNLNELVIRDLGKLDESDLACLADFPALTGLTLDFEGSRGIAMRRFSFLGRMEKLETLRIEELGEWNMEMMEDIAAATGLKSLELNGIWNLPTAWLEALGRLPALEKIVIVHCLDFRNLDFLRGIGTLRRITLLNSDNLPVKALLSLRNIPFEEIDVGGLRHFAPVAGREFVAMRLAWPEARVH